jgi:transitional endoplasmic reticulum ATPase
MGFELAIAAVVLVGLVAVIVAARRRSSAEDQARRAAADTARRWHRNPGNDLGGSGDSRDPLAGLFAGGPGGSGMWSRSYTWDADTGRWVEVTGHHPGRGRRRAGRPRLRRQASLLDGMLDGGEFRVEPPDGLPTFADVGGMEALKREVRDTVGLMLEHPDVADRYGIEWNGILLHGPPGVGKTYFARAIAGEFGLNVIHVSTGDLVSAMVGGSARNIDMAFEAALGSLPCLLFFDEFDSVAQRRDAAPDQEARRTVNQLLSCLEAHRGERRLLVMAATNSIEHLDPAVIRPGRFDRHIRIDVPDAAAREAIFRAQLHERPAARSIDLDELVRRTEGMTPAAIAKIVDTASLEVFREATRTGRQLEVDTPHLLGAVERYGGRDRPTVEHWTWDSLILPPAIKAQLRQLQSVIEDPESARRFGVDPPTGLLLAGPPGTGKTTIAKVLAAQARCSFYPISGADVLSKWVGESEGNIRRLFERARANRPSIVFIDEIDAVAGRRGELEVHDTQVNQLLAEIDGLAGQRGVFVIGATNRPDQLDPALLRGGHLSRTVVLGLPDEPARLAVLRLYSARMPTVAVSLEDLAGQTEGFSPADLRALCQEAALVAMARDDGGPGSVSAVTQADFEEACRRLRPGASTPAAT